MNHRMQVWLDNKKTVDGLNAANAGTGVTFGMNSTSDLNDDEFNKLLGFKGGKNVVPPIPGTNGNGMLGGGRRLQSDMSKNWITEGKVHPVKNQGECGSCWAFAAGTVQESMQSIKDGKAVTRISEQEGVDCDKESEGCNGGWMNAFWRMSAKIGSQANETYKY